MRQIRETYKKTGQLHYAYGVFGDKKSIKNELFDFFKKDLNFPVIANPDFWQGEFNVFKIADSRSLNKAHLNKPVKFDRKVFVVFADFMTKDAQNSLLKIFEEPRADTIFFLILPESTNLISTLESRLVLIKSSSDDLGSKAEDFLNAKVGKRLEMVVKILKDIKDEKSTKSEAITFIKNIEKVIKANLKLKNGHSARGKNLLAIEDLEKAISYANDESPSLRVILEHLALVL